MYSGKAKDWLKHADFILFDLFALMASFCAVYLVRKGSFEGLNTFLNLSVLLSFCLFHCLIAVVLNTYSNILRRGYYKEFVNASAHAIAVTAAVTVFLYFAKIGAQMSRLQVGFTGISFGAVSYLLHLFRKYWLKTHIRESRLLSLLVVTNADMAEVVIANLTEQMDINYRISGLVILDENRMGDTFCGVPVVANADTMHEYACREWVDEVLFDLGHGYVRPDAEMQEKFLEMGIATHVKLYRRSNDYGWQRTIEQVGPYMVLTRAAHVASLRQRILKRTMDICGGLVGSAFTGILLLIIGPIIYLKSPGPIIFKQERIGRNGRRFKMYKIRSMVMNADALKKKYMAQNRVSDGMMFKLDWDPRIIGNKELPDGTRKTGIGEFIRKTSLDEFPQFINVLKGEMSLVGTRPPTVDEWEKYELHHRSRMAVKPGITGMWQVSGRSEITDFEEVVRLDREYISQWNIGLDIKILFRTVGAVLTHRGSM